MPHYVSCSIATVRKIRVFWVGSYCRINECPVIIGRDTAVSNLDQHTEPNGCSTRCVGTNNKGESHAQEWQFEAWIRRDGPVQAT